jgi:hypothetical protein
MYSHHSDENTPTGWLNTPLKDCFFGDQGSRPAGRERFIPLSDLPGFEGKLPRFNIFHITVQEIFITLTRPLSSHRIPLQTTINQGE